MLNIFSNRTFYIKFQYLENILQSNLKKISLIFIMCAHYVIFFNKRLRVRRISKINRVFKSPAFFAIFHCSLRCVFGRNNAIRILFWPLHAENYCSLSWRWSSRPFLLQHSFQRNFRIWTQNTAWNSSSNHMLMILKRILLGRKEKKKK